MVNLDSSKDGFNVDFRKALSVKSAPAASSPLGAAKPQILVVAATPDAPAAPTRKKKRDLKDISKTPVKATERHDQAEPVERDAEDTVPSRLTFGARSFSAVLAGGLEGEMSEVKEGEVEEVGEAEVAVPEAAAMEEVVEAEAAVEAAAEAAGAAAGAWELEMPAPAARSVSAPATTSPRSAEKVLEVLTDERILKRDKQISFGKNTEGYKRYCAQVPKESRGDADPKVRDGLYSSNDATPSLRTEIRH